MYRQRALLSSEERAGSREVPHARGEYVKWSRQCVTLAVIRVLCRTVPGGFSRYVAFAANRGSVSRRLLADGEDTAGERGWGFAWREKRKAGEIDTGR